MSLSAIWDFIRLYSALQGFVYVYDYIVYSSTHRMALASIKDGIEKPQV